MGNQASFTIDMQPQNQQPLNASQIIQQSVKQKKLIAEGMSRASQSSQNISITDNTISNKAKKLNASKLMQNSQNSNRTSQQASRK